MCFVCFMMFSVRLPCATRHIYCISWTRHMYYRSILSLSHVIIEKRFHQRNGVSYWAFMSSWLTRYGHLFAWEFWHDDIIYVWLRRSMINILSFIEYTSIPEKLLMWSIMNTLVWFRLVCDCVLWCVLPRRFVRYNTDITLGPIYELPISLMHWKVYFAQQTFVLWQKQSYVWCHSCVDHIGHQLKTTTTIVQTTIITRNYTTYTITMVSGRRLSVDRSTHRTKSAHNLFPNVPLEAPTYNFLPFYIFSQYAIPEEWMCSISLQQEATVVGKHGTIPMVSVCDRSNNKSGTGQRQSFTIEWWSLVSISRMSIMNADKFYANCRLCDCW